jgi:metal-responsive CopG/Arc/MetJ family transcriptional regulator
VNTHNGDRAMFGARREKVTVTLRPERVQYADRKARERGVSRSEVIDEMIAEAEEREIEALMVAGYKAMAQENLALAEEGMESFWEVIKDDPAWPDAPERPSAER